MTAMNRALLMIPVFLLITSCRQEPITTLRVPKEVPAPVSAAPSSMGTLPEGMNTAPKDAHREVDWTVPSGWKEQPASAMRVGSFLVEGEGGQKADISVIPLSGAAGGDLSNINRWRGQIGLSPIAEADLPAQSRQIAPAGNKMLLVDYASNGMRLVAAIHQKGERSWFFKMTGPDAWLEKVLPSFMKFLESLRFHDH